jgi:hypothetical protein
MTEGSFQPMAKGTRRDPRVWPDGARRPYRFRFSPDYSAGSPFWSDESGLVPIHQLPLSPELARELVAWNDFFDTGFHHSEGWVTPADGQHFFEWGRSLCDRATAELGGDYVIEYAVENARSPWG